MHISSVQLHFVDIISTLASMISGWLRIAVFKAVLFRYNLGNRYHCLYKFDWTGSGRAGSSWQFGSSRVRSLTGQLGSWRKRTCEQLCTLNQQYTTNSCILCNF